MEDASKALIIVVGMFMGLMVLSLGIALSSSLSQYTDNAQKHIEENALQSFNTQFTKYINCSDINAEPEFVLTIHDIITVANIAYENNVSYDLNDASDNNYYVTVNIPGKMNLEKNVSSEAANLLKNNINKSYKCANSNIKINANTGRVCEITFIEVQP